MPNYNPKTGTITLSDWELLRKLQYMNEQLKLSMSLEEHTMANTTINYNDYYDRVDSLDYYDDEAYRQSIRRSSQQTSQSQSEALRDHLRELASEFRRSV